LRGNPDALCDIAIRDARIVVSHGKLVDQAKMKEMARGK